MAFLKDIDYATAVARVKVHETQLLSDSDIDRLIGAKTVDEAAALLNEKGYSSQGAPIEQLFDNQLENMWAFIREIAPDFSEFHFLLVKNDFHNLKAVLKGAVTGKSYENICLYPTITPIETLKAAIDEQRWSLLPEYMQKTAAQAYDDFVSTLDGQLSDICIDKGSINAVVQLSKDNKDSFIKDLGELIAATYSLRIAVRCSKLQMSREFVLDALPDCQSIDKSALASAAAAGLDELCEYIAKTKYSKAADELANGIAAFEKWCDNALVNYVSKAKYLSFTAAPLAAYIIKKEAELKCVRIVISGKRTGLDDSQIKSRIRAV